jgi:hypothetical protein
MNCNICTVPPSPVLPRPSLCSEGVALEVSVGDCDLVDVVVWVEVDVGTIVATEIAGSHKTAAMSEPYGSIFGDVCYRLKQHSFIHKTYI